MSIDWQDVSFAGVIVLVLVVIAAAWVLRREQHYTRIRIGFFVERDEDSKKPEPEWSALPAPTPPGIRRLLLRLLDVDRLS